MAVGKTTALRDLVPLVPDCHFNHEEVQSIVRKRQALGLDITKEADFVQNQRLFIQAECKRYDSLPSGRVVLDRGPEDVEFYTLMYPRSIGRDWQIEEALQSELDALRARRSHRILFLRASATALRNREASDTCRGRGSFGHYIRHIHPLEEDWFMSLPYTDVLDTDSLCPDKVRTAVLRWMKTQWDRAT